MEAHVHIDAMAYGPAGVGRLQDGKAVFVDGAVPGDVARVEIVQDKPSFAVGKVLGIEQAGAGRVEPACALAGVCGGCSWMHLSYEAQLAAKRGNVVAQLARIGGMGAEAADALVAPCVPCKRPLGYRNKLELAAASGADGRLELGFHRQGEGAGEGLVAVDACPLACGGMQKAPKALRGALRYLQGTRDLGILRVGVRESTRTRSCEVAVWTRPGQFPRAKAAKVIGDAVRATSIVRVVSSPTSRRPVKSVEALAGDGNWRERTAGFGFRVSAPSFFQVNTEQAEWLVQLVLDGLRLSEGAAVADLYCGIGTFTLPLARRCGQAVGVESAKSSVRDLRRNAQAADAAVEVLGGDAARELSGLGPLDALVVDPPRAGLARGVCEGIAATGAAQVAYVSCDPATWARDVARFAHVGYKLRQATPVDLFPQTYHVETVSLLTRTSAMHPYIGVSIDVSELDGFKKKPAGAKPMRKSENT